MSRTNMKLAVSVGTSMHGTPLPTISIETSLERYRYRAINGLLYALAADIELTSSPEDRWITQVTDSCVYLELNTGSPEEVERGKQILSRVAQNIHFRKTFHAASSRAGTSLTEVTVKP